MRERVGLDSVSELHQRGRARWPNIALEPGALEAHLREHDLSPGPEVHAEDLYVALAAASGDAEAIAAIETQYLAAVAPAIARFESDELLQRVRYRLFAEQRIRQYSGRGALKSWLRVVAVREALMASRATKREVDLDEAEALLAEDGEIAHMKSLYGAQFKAAFAIAFAALEPEERNMLRYHYLDDLGFEEIARMRRVHRTTITRAFQKIREALLVETRAAMMRDMGTGEAELESIMRLIESQLDVSLHRLLSSRD
jgi:RNA polymerase sigma-70 factor, ECF subfamily